MKLKRYTYCLGPHPLGRWAVVTVVPFEAEQPTQEEWERIKDALGEERDRELRSHSDALHLLWQ